MKHGGDIYRNKVYMDFSVNLNPLGAPEEVLDAVRRSVDDSAHYPDLQQAEIRELLAGYLKVQPENVCAGNGASELLLAAVNAVRPKKALIFEPAFSGYQHALNAVDREVSHQLLKEENGFTIGLADLDAITEDMDLVFVCDPGNPAGRNVDPQVLTKLLNRAKECGAVVILDESFYALSDAAGTPADRATTLVRAYDHLIIIRSLTKLFAMPGIRMGYALANSDWISRLTMQLPEWNLPITGEAAIKAGIAILTGTDYAERSLAVIRAERNFLATNLKELGLFVYESNAPYLLIKGPADLAKQLLKRGILIRECSDFYGLTDHYFRIAVKAHAQNEALLAAMKECLC